jgi:LmbE family N-acetylglucosaminyl deacetylase
VDVSATIGRKVDALRAHASQIRDPNALATRVGEWAASDGARIGVAAAEDFRLSVIDDDEDEGPAPA